MRLTCSIACAHLRNRGRGQHLALFLERAHAVAVGLRSAADQDHRPAILLRVGEAGEAVDDAGAGHDDARAGPCRSGSRRRRRHRTRPARCACRYRAGQPSAPPRRSARPGNPTTPNMYSTPCSFRLFASRSAPLISAIISLLSFELVSDPACRKSERAHITHLWRPGSSRGGTSFRHMRAVSLRFPGCDCAVPPQRYLWRYAWRVTP